MRKATARVFACLFLIFQGLLAFAQTPGQNASLPPAEAARVRQIIEGLEQEGKIRPYFQHGLALVRKDWWDTLPPQHRENTAKYLSWGSFLKDGDLVLEVFDTSVTVRLAFVNEIQEVDLTAKALPMELDVARAFVFGKSTPEGQAASDRLNASLSGTSNPYAPEPTTTTVEQEREARGKLVVYQNFINIFLKDGDLKKIDPEKREALVDRQKWNAKTPEQRTNFAKLLSDYCVARAYPSNLLISDADTKDILAVVSHTGTVTLHPMRN